METVFWGAEGFDDAHSLNNLLDGIFEEVRPFESGRNEGNSEEKGL